VLPIGGDSSAQFPLTVMSVGEWRGQCTGMVREMSNEVRKAGAWEGLWGRRGAFCVRK